MSSLRRAHTAPLAVIASDDADCARLNLERDAVAPWEDGARTDNRRGTYEWWYFEAHLDDGSSLVAVFMNKDLAAPNDPLRACPIVTQGQSSHACCWRRRIAHPLPQRLLVDGQRKLGAAHIHRNLSGPSHALRSAFAHRGT